MRKISLVALALFIAISAAACGSISDAANQITIDEQQDSHLAYGVYQTPSQKKENVVRWYAKFSSEKECLPRLYQARDSAACHFGTASGAAENVSKAHELIQKHFADFMANAGITAPTQTALQ